MNSFLLTIATLEEVLFMGEAESLTLPGLDGEITILREHMPLISLLKVGWIKVKTGSGEERILAEEGGVAEISGQGVSVLLA